jgi:hypothetical protein
MNKHIYATPSLETTSSSLISHHPGCAVPLGSDGEHPPPHRDGLPCLIVRLCPPQRYMRTTLAYIGSCNLLTTLSGVSSIFV